jgi:hypothetical protein
MCDNLMDDLDDLLIDDLTPEKYISTVHVNDGSVAEGRQRGVSSYMVHCRTCMRKSSSLF